MSKPLLIGFGHAAQSGKSSAADHIQKRFSGQYKILRTSFAKALRKEIHDAVHLLGKSGLTPERALRFLCAMRGVDFDEHATVDEINPYGKQRRLLQAWGTEFRRSRDPLYWVNCVAAEIAVTDAQVVLIDDIRFINELQWVKEHGKAVKVERRNFSPLAAEAARHVSETELSQAEWDEVISVTNGEITLLHWLAADLFKRQITQNSQKL